MASMLRHLRRLLRHLGHLFGGVGGVGGDSAVLVVGVVAGVSNQATWTFSRNFAAGPVDQTDIAALTVNAEAPAILHTVGANTLLVEYIGDPAAGTWVSGPIDATFVGGGNVEVDTGTVT